MKTFVVIEGCGEYSDRHETPIISFKSEEAAKQFIDWLRSYSQSRYLRYVDPTTTEPERAQILVEAGFLPNAEEEWASFVRHSRFVTAEPTREVFARAYLGDGSGYDYKVAEVILFDDFIAAAAFARGRGW